MTGPKLGKQLKALLPNEIPTLTSIVLAYFSLQL